MVDIKKKANDAENKMHELKGRAKQKKEDASSHRKNTIPLVD
ncbi:MAG: hypothetical protein NVS1B10_02190 [Candidatus Saccharimonadales bacterium]